MEALHGLGHDVFAGAVVHRGVVVWDVQKGDALHVDLHVVEGVVEHVAHVPAEPTDRNQSQEAEEHILQVGTNHR